MGKVVNNSEEIKGFKTKGTNANWYTGWNISKDERLRYSKLSKESAKAKQKAIAENKIGYYQIINKPRLNPNRLMPIIRSTGLKALSLFSGGGGMDLGFDRAGFKHVASYELLDFAAESIRLNRPNWNVFSGEQGDVTEIDWSKYKGQVDVIHGGPPCQPFSTAGRQKGSKDVRDMVPEHVRCIQEIKPRAFVLENVQGLSSKKFIMYLQKVLYKPLEKEYNIKQFVLNASGFGVPQIRKRIIFVGIKKTELTEYEIPLDTHDYSHLTRKTNGKTKTIPFQRTKMRKKCMGVREALGLDDIGFDTIAPTLRCTLTGPRSTTSILSSTSAKNVWDSIHIWPNGVQINRDKASSFETKNGNFRLSVEDCAVIQGFPKSWKFVGPVYKVLGQIGNSVSPPMAYNIAKSITQCLDR